ncbi:hypothetical protein TI03_01070 [Achromatium sp. WMS1]|nr:hypothetical protein TI03_01070 [Achromatium sp. WMS1]
MKKLMITISISTLMAIGSITQAELVGNPEAGKTKAAMCGGCHGLDGNSPSPMFPSLAGQHQNYLYKQIIDFKTKKRQDPAMSPQAQLMTNEQDIADVSAYFAQQKPTQGYANPEVADLGEQIFRGGNPSTGVTACTACHGPVGKGNLPAKFPQISGQKVAYTVKALKDFRAGKRNNDMNGMMRGVAKHMTDAEIEAVAECLHGLSD